MAEDVVRTTTDLPRAVHRRASEIARTSGRSISAVIADLATRGLAALEEPVAVELDPVSGLPVLTVGRPVTAAHVAVALDDE